MKPIGPLMREHRLIEKMLHAAESETRSMQEHNVVDPVAVDTIVDFIRTYADRTHHGKEENILFRDLAGKKLSREHGRIMQELIDEHVYARRTVTQLVNAKEQYLAGHAASLDEIVRCLNDLAVFYPRHIEKEDKDFFFPCLDYFTNEEQDTMLREFWEFDRIMIHEKYAKVAENFERNRK